MELDLQEMYPYACHRATTLPDFKPRNRIQTHISTYFNFERFCSGFDKLQHILLLL